jgi:hypothetical protein
LLAAAVVFGVLVCVRYLLFAYLFRDKVLAVIALAALSVFAFVGLLLVGGGMP